MAISRRKAPKQEAPQTIEQVVAMIAEYRDLLDKRDEIHADADSSIAKIEAARDAFAAPIVERSNLLFRQLRVWWGVAAQSVTDGKRKSVTLGGCMIGERTTTAKFQHSGMKVGELIDELADLGMTELLRFSTKLDKQACIRAIKANDELGQLLIWIGARNHQSEEFFIDRPKKDTDPEVVDVAEEAA